METKDVIAFAFSAITAAIGLYNWRATRRRTKLKDDLDILKRYREEFGAQCLQDGIANDLRYVHLRAKIQRRMVKTYVLRGTDWSEVLMGAALAVVALAPLVLAGFTGDWSFLEGWSAVLLAVAGGTGVIFLWGGLKDRDDVQQLGPVATEGKSSTQTGLPQ